MVKIIHQIQFRLGLRPNPTGGAYDAPPDPLLGWRGTLPPQSSPTSFSSISTVGIGVATVRPLKSIQIGITRDCETEVSGVSKKLWFTLLSEYVGALRIIDYSSSRRVV